MVSNFAKVATLLSIFSSVSAAPTAQEAAVTTLAGHSKAVGGLPTVTALPEWTAPIVEKRSDEVPAGVATLIEKRSFSCSSLVGGLTAADCNHMSSIGMWGQGKNSYSNNGAIWIGTGGPNTFTFRNWGGGPPVTLVMWAGATSWVNANQPYITYSLANLATVTISVANGVNGAFAGLYNELTYLLNGQVFNTWGEFSTGSYPTTDVTRLVNAHGNGMSVDRASGCIANMDKCVFECKDSTVTTCGASGSYNLVNCAAGSQTGAGIGYYLDTATGIYNPGGGCTGVTEPVTVTFYN